jgi:hypothetical protein
MAAGEADKKDVPGTRVGTGVQFSGSLVDGMAHLLCKGLLACGPTFPHRAQSCAAQSLTQLTPVQLSFGCCGYGR